MKMNRYKLLLIGFSFLLLIMGCDNSTAPTDCAGVVNGTAAVDDCGVCAGGTTGNVANADKDCDNVCNGGHEIDGTSGACSCDNGVSEDCAGVCGGSAVLSGCDSVCNSTAVEDDCGICGGDGSTCSSDGPPECIMDCPDIEEAIICVDSDEGGDCTIVGLCTIFSSWANNSCLSDCSVEVLSGGVMEMVNTCTECLANNNCEEMFTEEPVVVQVYNVNIQDMAFSPSTLTISVGETVTWTLTGGSHSVVSDDDGVFSSPSPSQPLTEPFQHTFEAAGVFGYHCGIHSSMTGTITVTE